MRRIALALTLLLASPLAADELLDRLGADDPQVREKAQKEMRELSPRDLEDLAEQAKDPEAAATLRQEIERRRDAPVNDRAEALVKKFATKLGGEKDLLALDTYAIPVLVALLGRTEEVPNMFYSGSCFVDFTPIPLDLAARTWLEGLTGEKQEDWKRWSAGRRGRPLAEVVLDGLTRRGYAVRSGKPEEAARALLAAFEGEVKKGWPSPLNQWRVDGMAFAARWLLETRMGEGAKTRDLFAPKADEAAPYREWLAANRGCIAWNGRNYSSTAKPENWIAALDGDDRDAVAGALRLLPPNAAKAEAAARRHIEAHPVEVLRILAAAKSVATAGELRPVLKAMGGNVLALEFRGALSGDAVAELIRGTTEIELRTTALWVLAETGAPRHAALALEFATNHQHTSGDPADWLNGRAAQAVAALGDDAQVAKILPWLQASNEYVRLEVALPLLRRGRKEAWPVLAECLATSHITPHGVRSRLGTFIDDLPIGDDPAAWHAWGKDLESYSWDREAKHWKK
ncbi:MAG: HEAT repeat domain-containing protein [Planctomycetota bacterium]